MILAIIQARTGSKRLPKKVLLGLEGRTVLEHVITRVRGSRLVSDVVVATTRKEQDLKIAEICSKLKTGVFRGSENDVLDRFYSAAKLMKPDSIARITCDCPLIDPKLIDEVIMAHTKENGDYTTNGQGTYPDGEDVEVFKFGCLERVWREAKLPSEREHVTPYFYKHPEIFKLIILKYKDDLSGKRWTLDEKEDYEFISRVYKGLYKKNPLFGMEDILQFLAKHPELENINSHIARNTGYQKSLKEDRLLGENKMGSR